MTDLLLFPFNGNAREALDCLGDAYRPVGFIDDNASKHGEYEGIPIGGRELLSKVQEGAKVLAIPGSVNTYSKLLEIIHSLGVDENDFATVLHPSVQVSSAARIGTNTLIMAGCVITHDAQVGDHCCLLPNTVVHHDAVIGDGTTLAAGVLVAGYTTIGSQCYIGMGSRIKNNISIGEKSLIGMGSNVLQNVTSNTVVIGNPAKEMRS